MELQGRREHAKTRTLCCKTRLTNATMCISVYLHIPRNSSVESHVVNQHEHISANVGSIASVVSTLVASASAAATLDKTISSSACSPGLGCVKPPFTFRMPRGQQSVCILL